MSRFIPRGLAGGSRKPPTEALAIVVSYTVYPGPLIESISESGIPLRWHIHHHGPDAAFAKRLKVLAKSLPNATLFDHRQNRGLSRSWNDSLSTLDEHKDELGFIFNDDLYFKPGGFNDFYDFVQEDRATSGGGRATTASTDTRSGQAHSARSARS